MTVEVIGKSGESYTNYVLLNYLRTPINETLADKNRNSTFGEAFIAYYVDQDTSRAGDHQSFIRKKTQEYFGIKYPHLHWKLFTTDKNSPIPGAAKGVAGGVTTSTLSKEPTLVEGGIACATLPNPNHGSPIMVEMVLYNEAADAFLRGKFESLKSNEFHCDKE